MVLMTGPYGMMLGSFHHGIVLDLFCVPLQ